ncbi:hypothetical protein QO006_003024 [Deinococcus enclensis]|uniref:Transposase n=1 Tax=Deinococcus enclensis TaxID=1049582 RepID=A0ABT9MG45_9DEIO|nr:hypothetical protein [Deinococcus enclensis]
MFRQPVTSPDHLERLFRLVILVWDNSLKWGWLQAQILIKVKGHGRAATSLVR